MITPGMTFDNHLMRIANAKPDSQVTRVSGADCYADIVTDDAFLDFHSPTDRTMAHRPYLHMMGECRGIRPMDGQLPFQIDAIRFEESEGLPVDMIYEFTDEELAVMARKGMFHTGYSVPDIIRSNYFEDLPVVCDFTIMNPELEEDIPVVFAHIDNPYDIQLTTENCGYNLSEYFETYQPTLADEFDEFDDITDEPYDFDDEYDDAEPEVEEPTAEPETEETVYYKHVVVPALEKYKEHLTEIAEQDASEEFVEEKPIEEEPELDEEPVIEVPEVSTLEEEPEEPKAPILDLWSDSEPVEMAHVAEPHEAPDDRDMGSE